MAQRASPTRRLYDTSAQTANSDLFSTDMTPNLSASTYRITIALKSASVVNVKEDDGNSVVNYDLNSGATIDADEVHVFDVPVRDTSSYNIQLESSVGIKVLQVDEVRDTAV